MSVSIIKNENKTFPLLVFFSGSVDPFGFSNLLPDQRIRGNKFLLSERLG